MPKYVNLPGIGEYKFPDDMSDAAIYKAVEDIQGVSIFGPVYGEQPVLEPLLAEPVEPEPEEAGFKSSLVEGLTTLFDLDEAVEYGVEDTDTARTALIKAGESDRAQQAFDDITSVGDFWKWTKQLAGQSLGFIAPSAGAAAAAGLVAGPIGAGVAFGATSILSYLTTNLTRQAQENQARIDKGEKPDEASIPTALASATGQAVLDYVGFRFFKPLGKLIGLEGSKVAQETFEKIAKEGAEKLEQTGVIQDITIGAGKGVAFEVPQELVQTVLERSQAGVSFLENPMEYAETAVGAAVLGAPIGATSNIVERIQKTKTDEETEDLTKQDDADLTKQDDADLVDEGEGVEGQPSALSPVQTTVTDLVNQLSKFNLEGTPTNFLGLVDYFSNLNLIEVTEAQQNILLKNAEEAERLYKAILDVSSAETGAKTGAEAGAETVVDAGAEAETDVAETDVDAPVETDVDAPVKTDAETETVVDAPVKTDAETETVVDAPKEGARIKIVEPLAEDSKQPNSEYILKNSNLSEVKNITKTNAAFASSLSTPNLNNIEAQLTKRNENPNLSQEEKQNIASDIDEIQLIKGKRLQVPSVVSNDIDFDNPNFIESLKIADSFDAHEKAAKNLDKEIVKSLIGRESNPRKDYLSILNFSTNKAKRNLIDTITNSYLANAAINREVNKKGQYTSYSDPAGKVLRSYEFKPLKSYGAYNFAELFQKGYGNVAPSAKAQRLANEIDQAVQENMINHYTKKAKPLFTKGQISLKKIVDDVLAKDYFFLDPLHSNYDANDRKEVLDSDFVAKIRANLMRGRKGKATFGQGPFAKTDAQVVGTESIDKKSITYVTELLNSLGIKNKLFIADLGNPNTGRKGDFETEADYRKYGFDAGTVVRRELKQNSDRAGGVLGFAVAGPSLLGDQYRPSLQTKTPYLIHINNPSKFTEKELLETLTHEVGHLIHQVSIDRIRNPREYSTDAKTIKEYTDTWNALKKAHADWVLKNKNIRPSAMSKYTRAYGLSRKAHKDLIRKGLADRREGFVLSDVVSDEDTKTLEHAQKAKLFNNEYLLSFDEWFAENVSMWATSSPDKTPRGLVEKYFADIAKKIRALIDRFLRITGKEFPFLPNKEVVKFLNNMQDPKFRLGLLETPLTNFDTKGAFQKEIDADLYITKDTPELEERILYSMKNDVEAEVTNEQVQGFTDLVRDLDKKPSMPKVTKTFLKTLSKIKRAALLKILTVEQIKDIYGDKLYIKTTKGKTIKPLHDLSNAVNNMEGDTRLYITEAEAISQKIQDVRLENSNQYDFLTKLFYGSTYGNVDMSVSAPKRGTTEESILSFEAYQRLKPIWDKLDKSSKDLYIEVKKHHLQQYNDLVTGLRKRIRTAVTQDGDQVSQTEAKLVDSQLEKLFNFNEPLKFYFPLKRKGQYWVNFELNNAFVSKSFITETQADQFRDVLEQIQKRKNPDDPKVTNINSFQSDKAIEQNNNEGLTKSQFDLIEQTMQKVINTSPTLQGSTKAGLLKSLSAELAQVYVDHAPEQSALKSLLIKRRRVLGAEGDIGQVFAENATSMARQIARLENSSKIDVSLANLKTALRQPHVSKEEQPMLRDVAVNMSEHVARIKNPNVGMFLRIPNTEVSLNVNNTLSTTGFIYYLATPAAAMINGFQTPTAAASLISGKFGARGAYSALIKAARDTRVGGLYNNKPVKARIKTGSGKTKTIIEREIPNDLSKDEKEAVVKAFAAGVIDRTLIGSELNLENQNISNAERQTGATGRFIKKYILGMFPKTEQMNRITTFVAAYRLAKKEETKPNNGKLYSNLVDTVQTNRAAYKNAFEYALDMTNRSQGNYGYNTAGIAFKRPWLKNILMFKKYAVFMNYTYYDIWKRMTKSGFSKAEQKEASKQFIMMLGTGFAAAGLYGTPLWWLTEYMLDLLFIDDDPELDASEVIRNKLADVAEEFGFDRRAGEFIYKGPVQSWLDVEIATRAGVGAPIFHPPRAAQEEDNAMFKIIEIFGGPLMGIGLSTTDAVKRLSKGEDFTRSVESAMPLGIRNLMKAYRFMDEDTATTRKGIPLVDEITTFETFMQALGFTPAELSRQYDINNARKTLDKDVSDTRTRIIAKYTLGLTMGDKDMIKEGLAKIKKFNKTYAKIAPRARITNETIAQSRRRRSRIHQDSDRYQLSGMSYRTPKDVRYYDKALGIKSE